MTGKLGIGGKDGLSPSDQLKIAAAVMTGGYATGAFGAGGAAGAGGTTGAVVGPKLAMSAPTVATPLAAPASVGNAYGVSAGSQHAAMLAAQDSKSQK